KPAVAWGCRFRSCFLFKPQLYWRNLRAMKSGNHRRIDTLADIEAALGELCQADPALAAIRREAGEVPLRRSSPGYASLAGIVIAQQVSAASADAIHGRLCALLDPLTPEAVLAAPDELFRQAGLSRPKQRTLL